MRIRISLLLVLWPAFGAADTVVATKTLRAKELVASEDLQMLPGDTPGAATAFEQVAGAELKHAVYAGRPIMLSNVVKAALVERNQVVRAEFAQNGILIETDVRALQRGAPGDVIQAMNLDSKKTIHARVTETGKLRVQP